MCFQQCSKEVQNVAGSGGTGKTHIALAIGLAACQRGHRVRFTTAAALRDAQPTLRTRLNDGHQ
jgi:DNA replication protein DnaC